MNTPPHSRPPQTTARRVIKFGKIHKSEGKGVTSDYPQAGKTSLYNMRAHTGILDYTVGILPTNSEEKNARQFFATREGRDSGVEAQDQVTAVHQAVHARLDTEFFSFGGQKRDGTMAIANLWVRR